MLKLIKRGEKLEGKQMSQVKGGEYCGSLNWCQNCGLTNQQRQEEWYNEWFAVPIT